MPNPAKKNISKKIEKPLKNKEVVTERPLKKYFDLLSETKEPRVKYTKEFLSRIAIRTPEEIVSRACVALGIRPAKSIFLNVFNIQRKLGFPLIPKEHIRDVTGYAKHVDGKFGDYTLQKLLENPTVSKKLKPFLKSEQAEKRMAYIEKNKLPQAPPSLTEKVEKVKSGKVAIIGDSHVGMLPGRGVANVVDRVSLRGEGAKKIRREFVKRLKKYKEKGVAKVVISAGANNVISRVSSSVIKSGKEDPVISELKIIKSEARRAGITIKFMTIPPPGRWAKRYVRLGKISKKAAEDSIERTKRINNWIKRNKGIDLDAIFNPNPETYAMSTKDSSDGLHFRMGATANKVAGAINEAIS